MKRNKDPIDALLRQTARQPRPPFIKLEETIALSRNSVSNLQKDQEASLLEFLLTQTRFISRKIWAAQFLLFLTAAFCIGSSHASPEQVDLLINIISPLMILSAIPEVCKSIRYQAADIESCTRFGLKKVCLARFLLLGMTDLCMTTGLILLGSRVLGIPMYELAIQFLVPYNSTLVICLSVISYKKTMFSEYPAAAAGIFWNAMLFLITRYYQIYEHVMLSVWVLLLLLSCLYIGCVLKRMMKNTEHYLEVADVRN